MHPSDGDLRSHLDGELSAAERSGIAEHLESCARCRARRDELLRAEARVRDALERLPLPDPGTESARRTVRDRLDGTPGLDGTAEPDVPLERSAGPHVDRSPAGARYPARARPSSDRTSDGRRAFARAAGFVLLLLGGIAAGLPGSPLREWIAGIGDDPAEPAAPAAERTTEEAARPAERESSVRVAPVGDSARVALVGAEAGTRVHVDLVDGAGVEVTARAGTRFRSSAGRVEVTGARGRVSVRLPRDVERAAVTAGDRTLLRKDGDEVSTPWLDPDPTAETGMEFTLPDPPSPTP